MDRKDSFSSFLPLLLIPLVVGAIGGGLLAIKSDIFTSNEAKFKQLIQSGELSYSSQELANIFKDITYFDNETNKTYVNISTNNGYITFAINGTKIIPNITIHYKIAELNYYDELYLKANQNITNAYIEVQWTYCGSSYGTVKKTINITTTQKKVWSGYKNNARVVSVKICILGICKTISDNPKEGDITFNDEYEVYKGIRIDSNEETITLTGIDEVIIVTAEPDIINVTEQNYKLVADWSDNIQYAISDLKYREEFVNAINKYFQPTTYYKIKFGEDTWEFKKAKDKNVMALFENTRITLTPNDRVISILLVKNPNRIEISNRILVNAGENTVDTFVKLEPYDATFTGTVYFYSYSVWDRIVGFFKSLLRFDLADAKAYATGNKEYNETTITAIEPNYINLVTKLTGSFTISDSSTPADIKYADNSFSTLFAVKYPQVKCIFTSSGKAVCGKVFIIASQNNIVYIMASE